MANNTYCKEVITFYLKGTFRSYNAAKDWAYDEGYSVGSTDSGGVVALQKGEYTLPQKWRNMSDIDRANVDGIMYSENFREGAVTVNIYK